ncbi:MAG: SH3 domain-containing protein [Chloroflexota bacterium]
MRKRFLLFLFMLMIPVAWAAAQSDPPPVLKALADLNQRLGLQLTLKDFNWRWSQDVYPDSSLGCLQSGQTVVTGQVAGYQVTLFVNDITWDYRVSGDLSIVILCSPQPTPVPTQRPTNTPPPTYTSEPNKPLAPILCEGSLPFRLTVGSMGRVILNGLPNNVRSQPGSSGSLAGELAAGSAFYVIDGPVCSGGLTWWYIAETSSDLAGWTPEGRGAEYWLEPYYPYGTPTPTNASLGQFSLVTNTPVPGATLVIPTSTPIQPTIPPPPSPVSTAIPLPSTTPTFIPTTTAIVCSSALPPRLVIGQQGQVTPGIPNNLRQGPGSSTKYVGEIPPGGVFTVLDGPRCASGLAWWQVSYNGLTGWTPEGQGGEYWVEPISG